jgi:predicted DnaQ family exonuclease/DinG family helicase
MSLRRVDEVFAPGGDLSRVLAPGFEWRPQQREMALAVWRTLQAGGNLLVEAPTGVGKSLAYLVPGILWAQANRRPLVVSTYTRTLQDQLIDHDLPKLHRLIEKRYRAVLLKGRANYLCRNRWGHRLEEMRGTVEGEELERVLTHWVDTTDSGDLSEAPVPIGRAGARLAPLLPSIAGDARFCSTSRCTPEGGCFFKTSRARARDADIVVVNHALLVIDLAGGGGGLPEWSAAVIDEAHHLPAAAAGPLSISVGERDLESALKGLGGRGEPGCTDELRRALRRHSSKIDRDRQLALLRDLEEGTAGLGLLARAFWAELKAQQVFPSGDHRLRYGIDAEVRDPFPPSGLTFCDRWRSHLDAVDSRVEEIGRLRRGAPEEEMLPVLEAERFAGEARTVLSSLEDLLTPSRADSVYWIEPEGAGGATLRCRPLEVGRWLDENLFSKKDAVVLTSATLAIEGSFEHLAGRLGLAADEREDLALATPFRLEEQVAARILTGGPDPNHGDFAAELAGGIGLLAQRLRRKMLVLFTAHETLRRVEELLRDPLEERGIRVLAQGRAGDRRRLRAGFLEKGPAVLLGAASFWEGVDFPGEDLEVLVMARLPFLVPNDPVVESIADRLRRDGRDAFREHQLPEAIIRFRQGFGRLIRRRTDRGLFVVVDPRLRTRAYGRGFQRSVGVPFGSCETWEDLATEAEAWFAREDGSAPGMGPAD